MALRQIIALAALFALGAVVPASAEDMLSPKPFSGIIDELRFGVHFHDVDSVALPFRLNKYNLTELQDVSFDVLFTSPNFDVFRWVGSPRPEIGATVDLGGKESLVHAGLTWHLPIFDTPIYLEATLGAAAHTGYNLNAPPGFKNFGCTVNFYERWGIGTNIGDHATATLTYEHTSNGGLCEANDGLSNVGLRLGWKF